ATISSIIGDLNCDGDVDYLDAYILENLILGVGDTAEELSEQYPCLNENLNGLTDENIESLQEVVDILSEDINTSSSGEFNHYNLWFPDGLRGNTIYFNGLIDTDYTVPMDSTLYIIRGRGDFITNLEYPLSLLEEKETAPIIIPESTTISCMGDVCGSSPANSKFFVGRLVPKGVKVILRSDYTGNEHTVPADSILIITSHAGANLKAPGLPNDDILFDEEQSNVIPLIINEGSIFQSGGGFNGYIVDEDYFSSSGSSSTNPNIENTNDELLSDIQESYFHNGVFNYWESLPMDISAGDSIAEFIVPEGKYMRIKQIGGSGYSNIRLKRDGVLYSDTSPVENTDPLPLQGLNNIIFHENDSIYISLPSEDNVGYITIMYYLYDVTNTNIEPIYQVLSYPESFTIEPGKKLIVTQSWGLTMLTSNDFDNGNNNLLTIPYGGLYGGIDNMSFNSNIQISANENSTIIFNGYLIDD
ncbi:MAG: hypothetical protein CMP50_04035, partial [Flavobacteriales bacterium]|nr:hypothetical protein [Flavobacteriales bacterium]